MRKNTNIYVEKESHVEIITIKNDVIFIDLSDFQMVRNYTWYISSKGYACSRIDGKIMYLHRMLMNPGELQVDHINRVKLDNRRSNLRIVNNQQNHFNMGVSKRNKSGKRGVYYHRTSRKWCCQISLNGKYIYSELFENKEDAIRMRLKLEKIHHKI